MSYETGTNGLGVGQRYGAREVGNVAGVTCAISGEGRAVFEFDGTDPAALAAESFSIPDGRALVTAVYFEKETGFTAGTIQVQVDGVDKLTAAISQVTAGMSTGGLPTGPFAMDAGEVLTLIEDVALVPLSTGSYAKVIVEFTRV